MAVSGYEFVRHRVEREKIKFVSANDREIFCLLYRRFLGLILHSLTLILILVKK